MSHTIDDLLRREQKQADTPENVDRDNSGMIDRYDPRTLEMTIPEYKSDHEQSIDNAIHPPYPPFIGVTPESKQFEVFRMTITPGAEATIRVAFEPDYWKIYTIRGGQNDGYYAYPNDSIMSSIAPWCNAVQTLTIPGRADCLTIRADDINSGSLQFVVVACRNAYFDKG